MPIYEYRCSSCRHELEALQRFADAPLTTCPECGKATLVKLVSAAGFQLKGSGWYATDFKGSGGKPAATPRPADGDAKTGKSGADSARDGKSEAAPPAKSDTTPAAPAAGSTPAST
uniref:FmdB-family regulatory protein n=1 Tax=bacterium enrichment culture TaxID=207831 RepID=A0A0R7N6N1_9BACT|nr:FmdB-family regulatory protein [bacterium enrichment culture]